MTKKLFTMLFILLTAVWVTMLVSCKKDEKKDDTPAPTANVETSDQESVEDNNLAEDESENMDDLLEQESGNNSDFGGRYSPLCKDTSIVRLNPAGYSCVDTIWFERKCGSIGVDYRKITFSFNPNVACGKGRRYRKGKIEFTMTGNKTMQMVGAVITVKLIDYAVKLKDAQTFIKMEGTKTYTVKDFKLTPKSRTVEVVSSGMKIYLKNDSVISWSSTRTKKISWNNAIRTVLVSGTASGISHKGISYEITADSLVRQSDCDWSFLSGKITFKRADKTDPRILDFGSDAAGTISKVCDQYVKITVGTNSKVVSMK